MALPDTCPFCGGNPVKKQPWLAGARIGAGAGAGATSIGGSFRPANSREEYLQCRGCMRQYVDAERDIKTILRGLRVEPRVAFQIRRYYGRGPTATDLLTRHRTAIVRGVSGRGSIFSVSLDKDKLFVCLLYDGVRTHGPLVKSDDGPGGTSYYTFGGLSLP